MTGLCVFSLTFYPAACGRKGHGSGLPLPSWTAADFLSGQQLYSTIQHNSSRVWSLSSFIFSPPASQFFVSHLLSQCTFSATLVIDSHPARPRRVRSSDTDPTPPHDGPVRLHIVTYSIQSITGSGNCLLTSPRTASYP